MLYKLLKQCYGADYSNPRSPDNIPTTALSNQTYTKINRALLQVMLNRTIYYFSQSIINYRYNYEL